MGWFYARVSGGHVADNVNVVDATVLLALLKTSGCDYKDRNWRAAGSSTYYHIVLISAAQKTAQIRVIFLFWPGLQRIFVAKYVHTCQKLFFSVYKQLLFLLLVCRLSLILEFAILQNFYFYWNPNWGKIVRRCYTFFSGRIFVANSIFDPSRGIPLVYNFILFFVVCQRMRAPVHTL